VLNALRDIPFLVSLERWTNGGKPVLIMLSGCQRDAKSENLLISELLLL